MTPDIKGTAKTAAGWIYAVAVFVFRAVEWALLGPYRVLRTYADLGNRRSDPDTGEPGPGGEGRAGSGDRPAEGGEDGDA
ncbi:hypothetical protein BRD00_13685 [Halobacteriales archaeon QS_8_69_26]|nr:MAG: hypothetical protein BRD00_13685 [Halobacteriales archaeon QS_8_69_26]